MKVKVSLVLLVISLSSCMAQPQKTLLEKIDQDISSLRAIIKMSDTRIKITAGDMKSFSPADEHNFEQGRTEKVSDTVLHSFFKNLKISDNIQYPYNFISLDKAEFDFTKLLGEESSYFMNNADMEPRFLPKKIIYLDGTESSKDILTYYDIVKKYGKTEVEDGKRYNVVEEAHMSELEKSVYKGSSFSNNLAVLSAKPIKSIDYEIILPIPAKKTYQLRLDKPEVQTPYGLIKLDTVAGNEVHCSLPDTDNDRDIQIQAYYKDGRALAKKGSSSNTEITPQKRKFYLSYIQVLEQAKEEVKKENIKTEKDLEKWLKTHVPATDKNVLENRKSVIYSFAGPVSQVTFSVSDRVPQEKTFKLTYHFRYQKDEMNYFLAADFKNQKLGLINQAGKWVIQPQFNEHFRQLNKYFYWDQYNNDQNTYWLNHQTQKIEKVSYQVNDQEIYNGKYVVIEPRTNGLRGVVDATTGKIVLPMAYESIHFKGGKYWWVKKEGKEGVFDGSFKNVIPIAYDDVTVDGDYFLIKDHDHQNVYDKRGINLTKNLYSRIYSTYHDGLLLVNKIQKSSKGDNSVDLFVDDQNKIRIDFNAKGYQDAQPFSEGLAVVKNNQGDRGYLNTSGNVAIPFKYKFAYTFYPTSKLALVQFKDDSYALIDTKGKIVKKFEGTMYNRETDPEDRKSRIKFRDNQVYNEYGEEVKKGNW